MSAPVQPQSVNAPAAAQQGSAPYANQSISPSFNNAVGLPTTNAQNVPQGQAMQAQQIAQHQQGQNHMQSAPGVQGMPPQPQGFANGAQRQFAAAQPAQLAPNAALGAVIQPGPGIPPALVGRKVSEVLGMWNSMEQNVRNLTQPQFAAQQGFSPSAAVAPQPPFAPPPQQPQNAYQYSPQQRFGLPQPGSQANVQQGGAEYWQQQIAQTAQLAAQQAAAEAAAQIQQAQLPSLVQSAWDAARQQLPGFDELSQDVLQIAGTIQDKQLLTDPRMWQLAYNQAIGDRIANGQPLPPAMLARLTGQQQPQQQQNPAQLAAGAPQSMSASANGQQPGQQMQMQQQPAQQLVQQPAQQPAAPQLPPGFNQLNAAQPYQPYSTGAMFTEQPAAPVFGQSAQLSPDELHAARMMNMTPEQYSAWRVTGAR